MMRKLPKRNQACEEKKKKNFPWGKGEHTHGYQCPEPSEIPSERCNPGPSPPPPFLQWSGKHRTFQLPPDCLVSILLISEHQEYKCILGRLGDAGAGRAEPIRAKSLNRSIEKINGTFWSSLPFVLGEWPVQQRAQRAVAEVPADVGAYGG